MKGKNLRVLPVIMLLAIQTTAFGQLGNFNLFDGGVNDGVALLKAYMTPWANAFGADLNGGWYNSAKPHKLGGFDVTFTTNVTVIPDDAKSIDLSTIGFEKLSIASGGGTIAPTVAGSSDAGPTLQYVENYLGTDVTIASFSAPPGTGLGFVPAPMIQASIGLPKGTEITGRYLPTFKIPKTDAQIGLWGVGLKHSIKQWIPGMKLLPVGLSVFGAYTQLNTTLGFSLEPLSYAHLTQYTTDDFKGQEVDFTVKAFNVSLLASTALPVINVFGGIGYSRTQTVIDVIGNIPIPAFDPTLDITAPVVRDEDVHTIPSIDIKHKSGVRLSAGLRLKLAVLTIHGEYTYAAYSIYTAGIGISFR
ncbi:MAG: hypothetical protein GXO83_06745 [Chlorobi bacterium]|nr:hypothetical protein [Chlorobiota bacterium]